MVTTGDVAISAVEGSVLIAGIFIEMVSPYSEGEPPALGRLCRCQTSTRLMDNDLR
jgi:hypothetical protein